ncbi:MAG: hypothetical protein WCF85_19875 [Rhodospirillaceae bacterium]
MANSENARTVSAETRVPKFPKDVYRPVLTVLQHHDIPAAARALRRFYPILDQLGAVDVIRRAFVPMMPEFKAQIDAQIVRENEKTALKSEKNRVGQLRYLQRMRADAPVQEARL